MKLWLDDIREPWRFGHIGWQWAKTYEEATALLATGKVEECSLDHDLSEEQTMGIIDGEKTGYDVVKWMAENDVWPERITVHSMNPVGAERMVALCRDHGRKVYRRIAYARPS